MSNRIKIYTLLLTNLIYITSLAIDYDPWTKEVAYEVKRLNLIINEEFIKTIIKGSYAYTIKMNYNGDYISSALNRDGKRCHQYLGVFLYVTETCIIDKRPISDLPVPSDLKSNCSSKLYLVDNFRFNFQDARRPKVDNVPHCGKVLSQVNGNFERNVGTAQKILKDRIDLHFKSRVINLYEGLSKE